MSYGKYEYCGYCRYLLCENARDMVRNGKFKCDRENEWVFADARPLTSRCFWQRPSYQLSDCDEAIALSKKYRGFYITTTIFRMLGIGYNKDLDTLYAFKSNYLSIDTSATNFLCDYDKFGPRIAKMLELSDTNKAYAKRLYNFYIMGTLKLIRSGQVEDAKELYESMYKRLRDEFIMIPLQQSIKTTMFKREMKSI